MIEYVQFFPTLKCNQNCPFCFSRGFFYEDFPEEKIEQLFNVLYENEIKSFDILGGEPFLYKSLNRLVEKALEKNMEITISTNGSLIYELEDFLKVPQFSKIKIGVSINDLPPPSLLSIIKKHKLWIKSVITKNKIPETSLLEFAKNSGIKYYFIYMDALTDRDLLDSISFYEFMKKINVISQDVEPVFCKGFIGGSSNYRCPAGTDKITLMPDGSVYPCYLLARFKEYELGNIFKTSLKELLSSEKLEIFRKYNGNICHNKLCSFHGECKGGCVAHSIIHYGTHGKPDPRCYRETVH